MLQKDIQHRTTLLCILRAEAPGITAALQESQVGCGAGRRQWGGMEPISGLFSPVQSAVGPRLSSEHIAQLLSCLQSYIQSPQQPRLRRDLLQLQARLREDGIGVQRLQAPLLHFQAVVSAWDTAWGWGCSCMALLRHADTAAPAQCCTAPFWHGVAQTR